MRSEARLILLIPAFIPALITLLFTATPAHADGEAPGTFVLNPERLLVTKQRLEAGDPTIIQDFNDLVYAADTVMNNGPWSVMDKEYIPPSGDKHDFMSFGSYWWPNDWSPDGLPWVFRDGYVNPEAQLDLDAFWDTGITTYRLALAYYFTDDEAYAERAAFHIRHWFLDEATYMTPRFEYGSVIPGVDEDGSASLVTTSLLMAYIFDSIGLISCSPAWTEADQAGMLQWSAEYLEWLNTSPKVAVERAHQNNHGDHHDIHPALIYLFTGELDAARDFLETIGPNRIANQVEPDGTLPFELGRADSLTYHFVVLRAFAFLAEMGDNVGVDIWNYESEEGGSIRKIADLLIPYALGEEAWPYYPREPFGVIWHLARNTFRRSALGLWDPAYADVVINIPGGDWWQHQRNAYVFPQAEPADRDGNWVVDFGDIVILLGEWGPCEGEGCDLDGDMRITFGDLVILLSRWGRIPG